MMTEKEQLLQYLQAEGTKELSTRFLARLTFRTKLSNRTIHRYLRQLQEEGKLTLDLSGQTTRIIINKK